MRRRQDSEHFQVPLMLAFRDAYRRSDSRKHLDERIDNERLVSERGSLKRRGADESLLKQNLSIDLLSLVNTIDLESAVPLGEFEHVRRSVVNFGLRDVGYLTSEEAGVRDVGKHLTAALLQHEPRLHADTLHIERQQDFDEVNQRVRFTVSAEMSCRPFDVPIEFVAEVDIGSGKVQLTRLPV